MTKKTEQKTQDDIPKELEKDLVDDSQNEDLETQLLEAQQSTKDNWDKLYALRQKWKTLRDAHQKILRMPINMRLMVL